MKENDTLYWLWLSLALTPGCANSSRLIDSFSCDVLSIYETDDYSDISGRGKILSAHTAQKLNDKSLDKAEKILDYCVKNNIAVITPRSKEYPKLLMNIQSCPTVLYCRGKMPDYSSKISLSCVGTRRMTQAGRRCAYEFAYDLAKSGIIITSGMALGIDSVCHRAALDALGTTIAVLGSGIDVIYPRQNFDLMNELVSCGGAVITENAPGTPPIARNFPVRNRIVSGISVGTLVIEASERSGSLNTAGNALEQGRDLFSIPGENGEFNHIGTNLLLKKGAIPVTEASDIIDFYTQRYGSSINFTHIAKRCRLESTSLPDIRSSSFKSVAIPKMSVEKKKPKTKPIPDFSSLGENFSKIASAVFECPLYPDEISGRLAIPVPAVLSALSFLELRGIVTALPGGQYTSDI